MCLYKKKSEPIHGDRTTHIMSKKYYVLKYHDFHFVIAHVHNYVAVLLEHHILVTD